MDLLPRGPSRDERADDDTEPMGTVTPAGTAAADAAPVTPDLGYCEDAPAAHEVPRVKRCFKGQGSKCGRPERNAASEILNPTSHDVARKKRRIDRDDVPQARRRNGGGAPGSTPSSPRRASPTASRDGGVIRIYRNREFEDRVQATVAETRCSASGYPAMFPS